MVNYYNQKFAAENNGDLNILEIFETFSHRPHQSSVDAITCDPTSEKLFASGSHDHTIKLWDATNPAKCLQTISGNREGIWSLNYSYDGKKLVSASPEGVCKVWDPKSGKATAELRGHTLKAYYATFSTDNTMVATCGSDSLVILWDTRKPSKPVFVNNESKGVVLSCDFLNDQKYIVSTTMDGVINITDIATQKHAVQSNTLEENVITSNMIYHCKSIKGHKKEGNVFMVAGENKMVQILQHDPTQKYDFLFLESQAKFEGHLGSIRHVETNKDATLLLTSNEDHSLRVWDMYTQEALCILSGHTGLVSGGAFLNKTTIVSSSWDQKIKIWNYSKALE